MTPPSTNNMRAFTVGLLWHSLSSGNLGVGALTESNIALLCGVAEAAGQRLNLLVMGTGRAGVDALQAELSRRGHTLEVQAVRMWRASFGEQIRRCDLVVDIGEGDSFATIYGFKRFFYYWLSKNRVHRAGVPLVLAPQTIGPFDDALSRWMAKQVMRRCRAVFARDEMSRSYLHDLGMDAVAHQSIDVAFALPFDPAPTADPTGPVDVGVNVSGLLYSGGYTRDNQFGLTVNYRSLMKRLVQALASQPGVRLHLIGHVLTPGREVEDDVAAARALASECGVQVVMAPAFTRPGEAKSYIARMQFFTGARMHACIAAFSSGVPVVPMAYSRKFNGLFGTLGYQRLADCRAMEDDAAFHAVMTGFEQRAQLKQEVQTALSTVRQRLGQYEAALASLIRDKTA